MSGDRRDEVIDGPDRAAQRGARGQRQDQAPMVLGMEQPAARKTRRSRIGQTADDSDFPEKYRVQGMSYQWWAIKHLNQEVDNSRHVEWADGGWEPVRPSEMPGIMPESYKGNTIDRRGLRLYKRPDYLTKEALEEELYLARQQKQSKLDQALATPNNTAPRTGQKLDLMVGPGVKD